MQETITLCGSVKFKLFFDLVSEELQSRGNSVISLSVWGNGLIGYIGDSNKFKEILEETHRHKIDQSDSIFAIDVSRYIGKSTKEEIEYAKSRGKNVFYFSHNDLNIVDAIAQRIYDSAYSDKLKIE